MTKPKKRSKKVKKAVEPKGDPKMDALQSFFKEQALLPTQADYNRPGFVVKGQSARQIDVVQQMLHGSLDPRKKVKRAGIVVEYDDGSMQTLLDINRGNTTLDMHRSVDLSIPEFEHLEPHLWPDAVEVRQKVSVVFDHVTVQKPSRELAARRGKRPVWTRL